MPHINNKQDIQKLYKDFIQYLVKTEGDEVNFGIRRLIHLDWWMMFNKPRAVYLMVTVMKGYNHNTSWEITKRTPSHRLAYWLDAHKWY